MDQFSGHGVRCVRGLRAVFAGVSFALTSGGALILRGPNGSGKSSLLRLMAGLGRPEAGTIQWNGAAIGADPESHAARISYLGHSDAVKPILSVAANVRLWTGLRGGTDKMADAALTILGLLQRGALPARLLSAGQKKRLALARTIATPAALWLLDEPATALDSEAIAVLLAAIARHRDAGGMVVVCTHGEIALPEAATLDLAAFAAESEPA
jgi:heme exporter protein A